MVQMDNITLEVIEALKDFKSQDPWKGTIKQRKKKFRFMHSKLNEVYQREVALVIGVPPKLSLWYNSGQSHFVPPKNLITLVGRLSVITFLHEWGHALYGGSEQEAQAWSKRIFKAVFPEKAASLREDSQGMMHNIRAVQAPQERLTDRVLREAQEMGRRANIEEHNQRIETIRRRHRNDTED